MWGRVQRISEACCFAKDFVHLRLPALPLLAIFFKNISVDTKGHGDLGTIRNGPAPAFACKIERLKKLSRENFACRTHSLKLFFCQRRGVDTVPVSLAIPSPFDEVI